MGFRLLCTTLQIHRTLLTLAKMTHLPPRIQYEDIVCRCNNIRMQPLHHKIYDKDAGLDAQRQANKLKEIDAVVRCDTQRIQFSATQSYQTTDKLDKHFAEEKTESTNGLSDDPDVFGNVNPEGERDMDAGDVAEEEYIQKPTRSIKKLRMKEYVDLIKGHLNSNRLKDAIDVLEQRMLKEDRVKPDNYIYNLLISGCAKAGYTRKAFNLFNRMRQRDLKVTGGTYTSLFNACATAPYPAEGLKQANLLREIMLEKGYDPNPINYNAMIKAYGRCGDVKTAYMLADEMQERQLEMNASTFNFLLQACASDKEFGFRHCLLTWHKMLRRGIQPDYYSFNTVLRCARDCGFGDLNTMDQAIKEILQNRQSAVGTHLPQKVGVIPANLNTTEQQQQQPPKRNPSQSVEPISNFLARDNLNATEEQQQCETPASDEVALEMANTQLQTNQLPSLTDSSVELITQTTSMEIPNLLLPRPHLGSMISISEITQPHDRFLLLGGLTGFLALMKEYKITPDIQCFTTMLEVIPPTYAAEKQLFTFIRKIGLKADIDFFNVLIKKRSMRFDYVGAKDVLNMIRTAGLRPDIVTYGVLALGCQTSEEARELLNIMRDNGVRLNIQILGAMLKQGCQQIAFSYITEVLQITLDENVKPNDVFLKHLHTFYNRCARAIDSRHPATKTKFYKKGHAKFCEKLRMWYEEQGLSGLKLEDAIKKVNVRPYLQYKEEDVDGIEPLKNEKLSKKQKVRKYIKKIKLNDLKGEEDDKVMATRKCIE